MGAFFDKSRLWMKVAKLTFVCVIASMVITASISIALVELGLIAKESLRRALSIGLPISFAAPLLISVPVCWVMLSMADELARAKAELQHLSETDHLTGLLNRRGFEQAAARLIERARRGGRPVAVIACDIDRFKVINDTYGHAAGDAVIVRVADLIRDEIENCAVPDYCVGRMGGEEYAVLLDGVPIRPLCRYAERIRRRCGAEPVQTEGPTVPLTVSIGIGVASHRDAALADLLAIADRGLYRAKTEGRNRVGHEAGPAGRPALA